MKTTLIIGSEGQDGRLLFDLLAGRGDRVVGLGRSTLRSSGVVRYAPADITDPAAVAALIHAIQPQEIYYLAAHHHSSTDMRGAPGDLLQRSFAIHVDGLLNVLEGMRNFSPAARLFYASSSHVYGQCATSPQDEQTPMMPSCAYGITKAAGMGCCRFYREKHGLHASVGILYNHESPLRSAKFVTQRIVRGAVAISRGQTDRLVLGSLSASVDWGYASDYVEAMTRIVAQPRADEYVVATGEPHTVADFARAAFAAVGLDYTKHVTEDGSVPARPGAALVGNAARLRERTGWRPSLGFEAMVKVLVDAALRGEGHSV